MYLPRGGCVQPTQASLNGHKEHRRSQPADDAPSLRGSGAASPATRALLALVRVPGAILAPARRRPRPGRHPLRPSPLSLNPSSPASPSMLPSADPVLSSGAEDLRRRDSTVRARSVTPGPVVAALHGRHLPRPWPGVVRWSARHGADRFRGVACASPTPLLEEWRERRGCVRKRAVVAPCHAPL